MSDWDKISGEYGVGGPRCAARAYGEQGPDETDFELSAAVQRERQRCASVVLAWAESQEALGREEGAAVLRALAVVVRGG